MTVCDRFPRLSDRQLSQFESDCRDWGLMCGLTIGLARMMADPGDSDLAIAERGYKVARSRFAEWAGEVADPDQAQEQAVREVLASYARAVAVSFREGRANSVENLMTSELRDALIELEIVMGGQA